jgi:integrase
MVICGPMIRGKEMPRALIDLSDITLDETVEKYLESKKKSTAQAYEKCLKRFVKFYERPFPDYLTEIEEQQERNKGKPARERVRPGEDTLREFVKWHDKIGYSNYSTLQSVGALQNILKYYGITISKAFIETPPARPMKENAKHEWTLDQIRLFVEAAEHLRDKAYIMFAFQSGLSIGDIISLNYEDIRREFESGKLPLAIQKYREKTGVPIKTFIGRDAISYLRLYLQSRPNIKPSDPIFTMLGNTKRATTSALQRKLKDYAPKLEFIYEEDMEKGYNPARPHSLRSGFRSRLTGKMDGDLIEFFMAHEIGQAKSTYMNQPLDEIREVYSNYEHLLAIEKTSKNEIADLMGKERIPEEALLRIQSLETTVQTLIDQMTAIRKEFNTVYDTLKNSE